MKDTLNNKKAIVIALLIIGLIIGLIFTITSSDDGKDNNNVEPDDTSETTPSPEPQPSDDDNAVEEAEDVVETPVEVDTTTEVVTEAVVLPANWDSLTSAEKIALNPYNCEDLTKIRSDNGQCIGQPLIPVVQIDTTIEQESDSEDQTTDQEGTIVTPPADTPPH